MHTLCERKKTRLVRQRKRLVRRGHACCGHACCGVAHAATGRVADAGADTDATTFAIATPTSGKDVQVWRKPPVLRRQWLVLRVLHITPLGLSSVQGDVPDTASWRPGAAASVAGAGGAAAIATAATIVVAAPGDRKVPVRRQPSVLPRQWLVLPVLHFAPVGLLVRGRVRDPTTRQAVNSTAEQDAPGLQPPAQVRGHRARRGSRGVLARQRAHSRRRVCPHERLKPAAQLHREQHPGAVQRLPEPLGLRRCRPGQVPGGLPQPRTLLPLRRQPERLPPRRHVPLVADDASTARVPAALRRVVP